MNDDAATNEIRTCCRFQGRVQGVGFRYTTTSLSRKYQVTGYVMNCADGSVELVAEGTWAEVSKFVNDVMQTFAKQITDCRQDEQPATSEFADFRIRHS
ncbi:MAG: acylphosphatase [Planctomycetota bacterium]|nr:acylphosphatase [Planctomycetota bacterium]MDA1211555.1 acylphosphatase [Planctomycetota bacterium]